MSTDAEFRARARAEAIEAGMPPDAADYFVAQLGKKPPADQPRHPGTKARASVTPKSDRLADEFRRLRLPAALLTKARREGLPDATISKFLKESPPKGVPLDVTVGTRLKQAAFADLAAQHWRSKR